MPMPWPQISEQLRSNRAWAAYGGLGKLMEAGRFETWLCVREHECCISGEVPHFCFVYDEQTKAFVPWDAAVNLGLSVACSARRRR